MSHAISFVFCFLFFLGVGLFVSANFYGCVENCRVRDVTFLGTRREREESVLCCDFFRNSFVAENVHSWFIGPDTLLDLLMRCRADVPDNPFSHRLAGLVNLCTKPEDLWFVASTMGLVQMGNCTDRAQVCLSINSHTDFDRDTLSLPAHPASHLLTQ